MRRMPFALAFAATVAFDEALAQRNDIPEAERYVQLGTRLPPLPPGQGGQLFVNAPASFCADGRYVLEITHHRNTSTNTPAARLIAGPSRCAWTFDDMAPGPYTAAVYVQPDGPIVATGRGKVVRGAAQTLTVSAVETELEGTLRVNGAPPPPGVHLLFRQTSEPRLEWEVPVDPTGAYKIALDAKPLNETICIALLREPRLNSFNVRCDHFSSGLQPLDIDATMPRGVLRIEVPPLPESQAGHAFARITISHSDDPGAGFLTSFRISRGLRGDFIAELNRDYRIIVSRSDDRTVLATLRVPLTTDRPDARVRLPIEVSSEQR
jgi:hypothetical protein